MKSSGAISAAILAGGSGSRLHGINKANLVVGGESIISRQIAVLGNIFDELIVVTNRPVDFILPSSVRITGDLKKNVGPIGGIHAALTASSNESVFIIAGDMPYPDANTIRELIFQSRNGDCDILVPKVAGHIEPLYAIYRKSLHKDIGEYIDKGDKLSVWRFFENVNICYHNFKSNSATRRTFTNINFPSDLTGL